jgi:hypothetical protein
MLYLIICSSAFAKVELFLSDEFKGYEPEEAFQLLEKIEQESPDKNILLYIHGRNREVKDEWESLKKLENMYGVRILMFDWPSWSSLLSRPVKNAEESSVELIPVMNAFKEFKNIHKSKKISLLTHSMGNIVISHYLLNYYSEGNLTEDGESLFDNYISNAADIALRGHTNWLTKLDFAKHRYVLMNNRDIVLTFSYILDLKERLPFFYKLGLGFQNLPLSGKKIESMLDKNSTYIDLSYTLDNEHRYFENKNKTIKGVLNQLVNGLTFTPQNVPGKVKVKDSISFVYDK